MILQLLIKAKLVLVSLIFKAIIYETSASKYLSHHYNTLHFMYRGENITFVKALFIRITCPCVLYPLTPHFYIIKLGFTGVYIIFLLYPPQTVFVGGYTVFMLSESPSDRPTDSVSVTFCFLNILKNH